MTYDLIETIYLLSSHYSCDMCHMDTCSRWPLSHHLPLISCILLTSCHMAPDTRCLERREILTVLEFDEIRRGRGDSNDEVRFIIQDLEKLRILTEITFLPFFRKLEFSRVLQKSYHKIHRDYLPFPLRNRKRL